MLNYHGYIAFYATYNKDPSSKAYIWLEYEAKFTDGVCVAIERIPAWQVLEDGTRIYDEGYDALRMRR